MSAADRPLSNAPCVKAHADIAEQNAAITTQNFPTMDFNSL